MKKSKIFKKIMLILIIGIVTLNISTASAEKLNVSELSYYQQSTYEERDDGWIYVFEIYYPNNSEEKVYMFDGYNLKYKELDGYYIPIIDSTTNKELYRVTPEYITLSISEKSRDDISNIVDFFNEKQFIKEITLNDLNDLKITEIDKEYLVNIFNKTIKSEIKTEPGEYYNSYYLGKVNVESTDKENPGEWQASYILDFGKIYKVDIEFIDKNGNYLSDETTSIAVNNIEIFDEISIAKVIAENEIETLQKNKNFKLINNVDLKKLLIENIFVCTYFLNNL